tara:strand:+ start:430 stop:885 length:456 start_codon:yes stop_codon:yes gene_type:complete
MSWKGIVKQKTYEVYMKNYRNAKNYPSWTKINLQLDGYDQSTSSRDLTKHFFEKMSFNLGDKNPFIVEGDNTSGYVIPYGFGTASPMMGSEYNRFQGENVLSANGPTYFYEIVESGEQPKNAKPPTFTMAEKISNYVRINKEQGVDVSDYF